MKTVFINPERCIGCLQCELACAVEHSASKDEALAFLEDARSPKACARASGSRRRRSPSRTGAVTATPPRASQVCPTGAIYRDDEHGVVLIDEKKCIGCAMCAVVCPFDVVTFHPLAEGPGPDVAVAVKCDGCVDRVSRGDDPACVEVCKVDALVFGELNDLVAAGRVREAGAVLAAAGAAAPDAVPAGDPLAAWHAWGAAEVAAAESRPVGPRSAGHDSDERSWRGLRSPAETENEGGPR